jgi:hypothetical protein
MTNTNQSKNTTAFYAQSAIAFAVALAAMIIGVIYLQVDPWVRAFLAMGTLFVVSSAFTLAKCVRDQQENVSVISRLDQARLERLLAEFDPYQTPNYGPLVQSVAQPAAQSAASNYQPAEYHA